MPLSETAPPRMALWWLLLLLTVAGWAYLYRLSTPALFDDPNDAQYAEVAREMVETGNWITPQLDYVLFLNKPALSYWLIALSFKAFGINELAARLPGALTDLVLLLLVWRLGAVLWNDSVGRWAAAVCLATSGLLLEARQVRPDLLLTAGVVGTLLAGTRLAQAPSFVDTRGARVGLQVALAVGLLAKGVVGLVLPAAALGLAMLVSGNFRLLRRLATPRAWWLFALLVGPWHLAMAFRHPGFAWDYIVNQHILFFLDRKIPRDSEGIPLWQFWAVFGARLFPWTLILPVAIVRAWPRGDERERWAGALVLGCLGTVMAFFSATSSRLEHYSIPALPACALLTAAFFARANRERKSVIAAVVVPLAAFGVVTPFVLPHIIATAGWLTEAKELPHVAWIAACIFGLASLAALALAVRPRLMPLPLIGAMCALVPVIHHGLTLIAPFNSSKPIADVINAVATESDTLVYEAPTEYQSGAGLFFYTRRKWWVLRPRGFVAPPYLKPHEGELFIPRKDLKYVWAKAQVFFVSDPLVSGRTSMKGVVPEPFWNVAHMDDQWVVSSEHP
jgi:4-amino-4-deoxy-L-arabinose transferase-like glycosyltransferase